MLKNNFKFKVAASRSVRGYEQKRMDDFAANGEMISWNEEFKSEEELRILSGLKTVSRDASRMKASGTGVLHTSQTTLRVSDLETDEQVGFQSRKIKNVFLSLHGVHWVTITPKLLLHNSWKWGKSKQSNWLTDLKIGILNSFLSPEMFLFVSELLWFHVQLLKSLNSVASWKMVLPRQTRYFPDVWVADWEVGGRSGVEGARYQKREGRKENWCHDGWLPWWSAPSSFILVRHSWLLHSRHVMSRWGGRKKYGREGGERESRFLSFVGQKTVQTIKNVKDKISFQGAINKDWFLLKQTVWSKWSWTHSLLTQREVSFSHFRCQTQIGWSEKNTSFPEPTNSSPSKCQSVSLETLYKSEKDRLNASFCMFTDQNKQGAHNKDF